MKKNFFVSVLLIVSGCMAFAEGTCPEHGYYSGSSCPLHGTTSESKSVTTSSSMGIDDWIPYWQNNQTTTITDYSDGSRDVTLQRNHGLGWEGSSATIKETTTTHYTPEEMRALGGNSFEPQAPNEAWLPPVKDD